MVGFSNLPGSTPGIGFVTKRKGRKKTMEGNNAIKIQESLEDMIKSVIDVQQSQGEMIKNMGKILDALQNATMTNLRFELHDTMMECILRGSKTPEEFDRVTTKFDVYKNLNGNHGIDDLYENQFKKLPIKEEN